MAALVRSGCLLRGAGEYAVVGPLTSSPSTRMILRSAPLITMWAEAQELGWREVRTRSRAVAGRGSSGEDAYSFNRQNPEHRAGARAQGFCPGRFGYQLARRRARAGIWASSRMGRAMTPMRLRAKMVLSWTPKVKV
jgi:hypothetical protein